MFILKPIEPSLQIDSFVMCLDVIREKDFIFSGELHDFWEAVFVADGHAVATAEERVINLQKGQILFHQPMEFHRIRSGPDSSPHLMILSFAAHGPATESLKRKTLELLPEEIARYKTAFALFEKAQALYEAAGQTAAYSLLAEKGAAELQLFLLEVAERDRRPLAKPSGDEKRFGGVVEWMNEHCEEWMTVEQIATACHMSVSNLKRLFALYANQGVAKYFLNLKLRRAMELLRQNRSTKEVTEQLGFSSINYFHTVFRRETGLTPGAYRKNLPRLLN